MSVQRPAYVITTCGKAKYQGAARAVDFYTGTFVKAQGRTAAALNPRLGRLVLSNKYGFMKPDHIIPGPYDSHWGYSDTMNDADLLEFIAELDLRPGDYVVNLGAREYARQTRRLFPEYVKVIWPAKHLANRSMGYHGQLFRALQMLGRVPDKCLRECEFLASEV